jgi:hypothetical protein
LRVIQQPALAGQVEPTADCGRLEIEAASKHPHRLWSANRFHVVAGQFGERKQRHCVGPALRWLGLRAVELHPASANFSLRSKCDGGPKDLGRQSPARNGRTLDRQVGTEPNTAGPLGPGFPGIRKHADLGDHGPSPLPSEKERGDPSTADFLLYDLVVAVMLRCREMKVGEQAQPLDLGVLAPTNQRVAEGGDLLV